MEALDPEADDDEFLEFFALEGLSPGVSVAIDGDPLGAGCPILWQAPTPSNNAEA